METIKRYWAALCALAVAVLYALWDRRGRKIESLEHDAEANKLAGGLAKLKDEQHETQEAFDRSHNDYDELKRQHAELMGRLGIEAPSKPDSE